MSDAPERIWIDDERPSGGVCHVYTEVVAGVPLHLYGVEYIRADLYNNTTLKAAVDMMADKHGWVRRERLDALTEQLEAARADAKEAEAYAEELAGDQVDLCSQLIAAEARVAVLEGALTLAANRLHWASVQFDTGTTNFITVGEWADEARATLAEIEGGET
jgi:hypothetical protein